MFPCACDPRLSCSTLPTVSNLCLCIITAIFSAHTELDRTHQAFSKQRTVLYDNERLLYHVLEQILVSTKLVKTLASGVTVLQADLEFGE